MDYQDIQVEISDRVAIISLQKPESGNTISDARIIEELETAIGAMQASNDVSVLILTGSGKIFSAGGNVKAMRDHSGMFNGEPIELYEELS